MPVTSRTGEDYAQTSKSEEQKKHELWETMKTDIMKNKSKKKRWADIEAAMKDM